MCFLTTSFVLVNPNHVTNEQKRNSLNTMSVLKEKRCGKLKVRTYADWRKQRVHETKVESASPTAHSDSLMLTPLADVYEFRDAAIADTPRVHLNAEINELVLLKMVNEQFDVMHMINEKHAEFVHVEGERRALCLMLNKALHDCIHSSLLWC